MTIVLLHGWGCTSASWQPLLSELQKTYQVIAIDLPGFGNSQAIENFSLDVVVDLIATQLPDDSVLIGWSLGGMLAVQIAAKYPRKVSHLITLAANVKFVASDDYAFAMPLPTNHEFNQRFKNEPIATLKLFSGLLAQGDSSERALCKKMRSLISPDAINVNWLQALQLLSQLDNRETFSRLTQPGLHIFGKADALVPAGAASVIAHLNVHQKVRTLSQTAHALHWSQPEKVLQCIHDFLVTASDMIEKKKIAQSFSRAAHTYDSVAKFQRDVGEKLLSTVISAEEVKTVVDLGCGTGHFTQSLQKQFPQAQLIGIDLAEGMLAVAKEKNSNIGTWLCADAENLPLANASTDVIFSNLALQWCCNLPELFAELHRALTPDGTLIFSTLGPNTLHQLKSAWQQVDNYVHVNRFESAQDIKQHLLATNFSIVQFEQQFPILEFERLTDLTRELKALGAHNINRGRATGLTGRRKIAAFKTAYEQFRRNDLLPATYEVFYIIAKKVDIPNG